MQFLRKAALTAAATLLAITLFTFGLSWSVYMVFHTPNNLKQALKSSGVYSAAIPALLNDQIKKDPQHGTGDGELPITRPEVRKIINDALPPQFLEAQTEQVLDNTYAWLSGKTPELRFSIQLAGAKEKLASGLQQYVLQRLNTLPTCTATDAIANGGDLDGFNATCVPAGTDKAAVAAKVRDEILQDEVLKDTTITAHTIKNGKGQTLDQQLQNAPTGFRAAKWAVWGGVLAIAAFATAVVFLSATRRGGVRKISVMAIVVGTLSAIFGWLANYGVHKAVHTGGLGMTGDAPLKTQILSLLDSLTSNLCNWWVVYGLVLVLLGAAALVALHLTQPKDVIDLRTPPTKPPVRPGEEPADLPGGEAANAAPRHEHKIEPPSINA